MTVTPISPAWDTVRHYLVQETPMTKSTALDPNRIAPGDTVVVESPITPRGTAIRHVRPGDTGTVAETDRKLGGKVTMVRVRMGGISERRSELIVFARDAVLTLAERDALIPVRRRVIPKPPVRPVSAWDRLLMLERERSVSREARIAAVARPGAYDYTRHGLRTGLPVPGLPGHTYGPPVRVGADSGPAVTRYVSDAEKAADYAKRVKATEEAARIIDKYVLDDDVTAVAAFLLAIA